ncbi:MAG: pimeloyl-ACP methyl ester esterase BioH [Gammaproteobacteria bacterium]|nr:pimeloyl-ACP methyl ester esterase BioH [Gammaproteobacteria bacterium]
MVKPHLVLLHGWGLNRGVWQSLIPRLESFYRVTALDLAGFGSESDRPVADLEQMVERLAEQVSESSVWLGWSLGGMVALRLAARFPAKVSKLIMVAASPRFVQAENWPSATKAEVLVGFSSALRENLSVTLQRFLALQVRGSADSKAVLKQLKVALAAGGAASEASLLLGLHILNTADLRSDLQQLKPPLAVFLGERDGLVPQAVAESLLQLRSDLQIELFPNAGHAPFLSHPELFTAKLRAFTDG